MLSYNVVHRFPRVTSANLHLQKVPLLTSRKVKILLLNSGFQPSLDPTSPRKTKFSSFNKKQPSTKKKSLSLSNSNVIWHAAVAIRYSTAGLYTWNWHRNFPNRLGAMLQELFVHSISFVAFTGELAIPLPKPGCFSSETAPQNRSN